jgi:predicted metal-binding protein
VTRIVQWYGIKQKKLHTLLVCYASTVRVRESTHSGAVKEVILRVTERAQKEVRGIELDTSSLECLRPAAATNQA